MAENEQVEKELNLDQKVTVKSIAGWPIGFARLTEIGNVSFPAEGSVRITRNEVISQVLNGNKLFTGTDGVGSHSTLIIEDAATRKEVGFDSENGKKKQLCFSDKLAKSIFEKSQSEFETEFLNTFITRAEKRAVMNYIKRNGINDYSKIRFAENTTGIRLNF